MINSTSLNEAHYKTHELLGLQAGSLTVLL
jgi:hypothetical protein